LQSNNPAFSQTFAQNLDYSGGRTATMTVQGTALKALVLLAILSATAAFSWIETEKGTMTTGFLIGSVAGGFVLALITMFKPTLAPWTSPVYAALEGIFLGALSRMTDERYPGLAIQAVALTGGVMFLMLFVYVTGIVKVTGQLTSAIVAATGAIALLYLATIVLSMFHIQVPFIMGSSPIGIAFSLFVVGLAAFNLLLDFDFIEKGSEAGLSKSMEWYGAFALMVTLVWLYLEVLRLLRKLQDRR